MTKLFPPEGSQKLLKHFKTALNHGHDCGSVLKLVGLFPLGRNACEMPIKETQSWIYKIQCWPDKGAGVSKTGDRCVW